MAMRIVLVVVSALACIVETPPPGHTRHAAATPESRVSWTSSHAIPNTPMTSLQGLTSLLSGGRLRSSTSNLSRSLTRPSRLIVLLLLFVACLAFIGLGPFGHTERLSTHLNTLHEVYHDYKQSGECAGWDPRVGKEGSHPGCLKARQWEQVGRAIRMEERPEEHSR